MLHNLVAKVHSGEVTPTDLVEESLRRIAASESLNAVTEIFADEAVREAKSHTGRGPLAGLPLLVKDMVRIKGHRTTFGSRLYADAPNDSEDDIALARLREAGAIVIGRTNTPEFGSVGYTANDLYGITRNPWVDAYSDRKSTRLNSSHVSESRMPSSA